MQISLLVEDRDLAFCFFDIMNAPSGSVLMELTTEGVDFEDLHDEAKALWLQKDGPSPTTLHVVPYDTFDFESVGDEVGFPIPTPVLVMDKAEFERRTAE